MTAAAFPANYHCRALPTDLFFPAGAGESYPVPVAQLRRLCCGDRSAPPCPALGICMRDALKVTDYGDAGFRAGMTPAQRRALRRKLGVAA